MTDTTPLLYAPPPQSSAVVVIMLFWTLSTSAGWQPETPQVSAATRKSPGLKKRMNSGDSLFSSV